jgi:phosphatidate cytidylyltransferase
VGAIFYEITKLKRNYEKEHKLPYFFALRWYWFGVTNFYFLRVFLPDQLARLGTEYAIVEKLLRFHQIISYGLICSGLVVFVLSLRRFTLRYQFQQLSWALVTLLICVIQGMAYLANIYNGLVWFLLPTLLVTTNDIFAYFFGFFLGRTPLIKLSPKKTWEGFIGGSICTLIAAVALCEAFERSPFFMCPQADISMIPFTGGVCTSFVPPTLKPSGFIGPSALKIHGLVLASFASLVAPFGGFFASGFKRAFKIKDFGDSIPGHGGLTDRFDCMLIMGMFTYIYFNTFVGSSMVGGGAVVTTTLTLQSVAKYIKSLSKEERELLASLVAK